MIIFVLYKGVGESTRNSSALRSPIHEKYTISLKSLNVSD